LSERFVNAKESDVLQYYSASRRRFLSIAGLTAAGLMHPAFGSPDRQQDTNDPAKPAPLVSLPVKEAIAAALLDAGCSVVTSVPATGTAYIFDAYRRLGSMDIPFSFNEEVAYSMSHGAAVRGVRSASIMKAHGLAKASNSVVDSLTAGTTSGCLILVTYDRLGQHSDNIFDLSGFLKGTGIPFLVPQRATIYQQVVSCFQWSEQLGLPVAIFIDTDILNTTVDVARAPLPDAGKQYKRDPMLHVVCPPLAGYQYQVLQAKLAGEDYRLLKRPPFPRVPDSLSGKWREAIKQYIPLFEVVAELRSEMPWVCGDTGLSNFFAFPPYDCIDMTTYYGGSLPLALGGLLAGQPNAWAITGDYAFIAAGFLGLAEAEVRKLPLKVLILNNRCALTTGGQPVPAGLLEQLLQGFSSHVSVISDASNRQEVRKILHGSVAKRDQMEIIIAEYDSCGPAIRG
jgi:TPP-dependent indolepyruvate ferredoxin oxidoreductase alpha subunit